MNPDLRALYEEVILEHNRHPRHYPKKPRGSTHHAHGFNPLCNDEIQVHLKLADDRIQDIGFEGAGCAI
jgi:nitrogen fixation NifU-like protein